MARKLGDTSMRLSSDDIYYLESYCADPEVRNFRDAADFLGTTPRKLSYALATARAEGVTKAQLYRRWSQAEDDLLKQLYPSHNVIDIAKRFDRTVSAIKTRARVIGVVQRKPIDTATAAEITKLVGEGATRKAICRIAKVNKSTLLYFLRRNNLNTAADTDRGVMMRRVINSHWRDRGYGV